MPLRPQEDCEQGKQRLSLAGKDPRPWCAWLHQEPEGIKRSFKRAAEDEDAQAAVNEAMDVRYTIHDLVRDCLLKYWDLMPARRRKKYKKYFAEADDLVQHSAPEAVDYRLHELLSQLANAAGEEW